MGFRVSGSSPDALTMKLQVGPSIKQSFKHSDNQFVKTVLIMAKGNEAWVI